MNRLRRSEGFPVIPDGAAQCVWVTAGVLTYKLCERQYRCETCPLDTELRHAGVTAEPPVAAAPHDLSTDLQGDILFFAPNHTWVRLETADAVVVGLDDFAWRLLSDPRKILLPPVQSVIDRGDELAVLFQHDNSFSTASPISGRVAKVNEDLMHNPHTAIDNPAKGAWLAELVPTNLMAELRYLFTGRKALAWQREESDKFEVIVGTLPPAAHDRLGPVMHDGKGRLAALPALVGPERYVQIVNAFLRPEEQS